MFSTNSRQSVALRDRRLPIVLLIGNLVTCLLLSFRLNQLLNRQAIFGKTLLDPGERQRQRGTPALASRRASSATNELVIGGFDRAMSRSPRSAFRIFVAT